MISNWQNLVARRDLLRELTLAELRRESQTSRLGWIWWLVDPFIMMLIYWAVVVGVFGRGARYEPYPVFVLCAVLAWKQVTGSASAAAKVLRQREALIKSIAFPTIVLPITLVASRFAFFLFGIVVLLVTAAVFQRPLGLPLVQLPALLALHLVVVTGLCLMLACFGALVRDLEGFMTHVLRIGFYMSPTLYGIDMVVERSAELGPPWAEWLPRLYLMNPFAGLITGYREAVFYGRFLDVDIWLLLVAQAAGALFVGWRVYLYFDRRVIKFL